MVFSLPVQRSISIPAIVTRDISDFSGVAIAVLSIQELLSQI